MLYVKNRIKCLHGNAYNSGKKEPFGLQYGICCFLFENKRRYNVANAEINIKMKDIRKNIKADSLIAHITRRAVKYNTQHYMMPQFKPEHYFKKCIKSTHKEERVKVPELLVIGRVARVDDKVDIIKRYRSSVYIILQQQLKRDLQRAPDNKRVKYNTEPAPDIIL